MTLNRLHAAVEIMCKSAWIICSSPSSDISTYRHIGQKSVIKLGRVAGKDSIGRPNYAVMCLTPMFTNKFLKYFGRF